MKKTSIAIVTLLTVSLFSTGAIASSSVGEPNQSIVVFVKKCSAYDKDRLKYVGYDYTLASTMGSRYFEKELLKSLGKWTKKTSSPNLRSALVRLDKALVNNMSSGYVFDYVPAISKAWNKVQGIVKFGKC